jgi:hypothetical protein
MQLFSSMYEPPKVLSEHLSAGTEKNHKTSVMIAALLLETLNWIFQNTKHKC